MKTKHRILAALICCPLLLAGCGNNESKTTDPTEQAQSDSPVLDPNGNPYTRASIPISDQMVIDQKRDTGSTRLDSATKSTIQTFLLESGICEPSKDEYGVARAWEKSDCSDYVGDWDSEDIPKDKMVDWYVRIEQSASQSRSVSWGTEISITQVRDCGPMSDASSYEVFIEAHSIKQDKDWSIGIFVERRDGEYTDSERDALTEKARQIVDMYGGTTWCRTKYKIDQEIDIDTDKSVDWEPPIQKLPASEGPKVIEGLTEVAQTHSWTGACRFESDGHTVSVTRVVGDGTSIWVSRFQIDNTSNTRLGMPNDPMGRRTGSLWCHAP